jgi:hypothetical protein
VILTTSLSETKSFSIIERKKEQLLEQETLTLELHIQYLREEDSITLLACKGYGTKVVIPDNINGSPIKKIGAYSFSDHERSLSLVSKHEDIECAKIEGIKVPGGEEDYICGSRLEEITLPSSIEVIDRYAFYNCKELNRIHLPGGRIQIENGAFMNCDKLREVYVKALPEEASGVRGILTERNSELYITFKEESVTGRFLFPEYYEDAIENTPARIFKYMIYGAGYRYRQCFEDERLDIAGYDAVFLSAEIQTLHETALDIAFLRLMYPYQLRDTMKQQYLKFIEHHMDKALKRTVARENTKELTFLTALGLITEAQYRQAQELAVSNGKKECAGILLKERLFYFPPTEKEYEL